MRSLILFFFLTIIISKDCLCDRNPKTTRKSFLTELRDLQSENKRLVSEIEKLENELRSLQLSVDVIKSKQADSVDNNKIKELFAELQNLVLSTVDNKIQNISHQMQNAIETISKSVKDEIERVSI